MRAALPLLLLLLGCRAPRPGELPRDAETLADAESLSDASDADDGSTAPLRVHVMTFNMHRYFDTTCDSGRCSTGDFEALPTASAFAAQTAAIAFGITRAEADVVCAQEVETEAALRALQDRLAGRYPTAVLGEIGTPGSVDVAVLARDPLIETRRHRAQPITRPDGSGTVFSREFLEVHLSRAGRRVVMFCAHFRSMVNDDPGRRVAEGTRAAELVARTATEFPDALVVMGGDLNDVPGSPTLLALEGGGLDRVARRLPTGEDATWTGFSGSFAFDHLLHATRGAGRVIDGSVAVLRDQAMGYAGSDHAALRADFAL